MLFSGNPSRMIGAVFSVFGIVLLEIALGLHGFHGWDVTGALGAVRNYSFGIVQGVVQTGAIAGDACPSCGAAAQTFDANGFIASRTDWNGNVTNYVHDSRGLETSRTQAAGTTQARTIETTWDTTYRLPTQSVEKDATGTTLRTTDFTYDTSGNLLTRTVTDAATSAARTWTYTYNSYGQVLTVDGPRTDVTDVTTYTYYPNDTSQGSNRGMLETVTDALGHTTTFADYNARGQVGSITDANGALTTLTYDTRGRLTGRTVAGEATTYGYDAAGELIKV